MDAELGWESSTPSFSLYGQSFRFFKLVLCRSSTPKRGFGGQIQMHLELIFLDEFLTSVFFEISLSKKGAAGIK